jgi:hypothetical protein
MSRARRLSVFLLAFGFFLEANPQWIAFQGPPFSTAEAVVGRPATPGSVAGVARRTTRRCAAGVYNC